MTEQNVHNLERLRLRARLPKYFRVGSLVLLGLTVAGVILSFYFMRGDPEFRMKGFPTALSSDVIAEVTGYERREMKDDVVQYYIRADRATTFADNHQELENVYLQLFAPDGSSDSITSKKAVYVPKEDKNFTAYFAGDVNISTRDSLIVKSDHLTYDRVNETATADEAVEFERFTIKGSSFGAIVNVPAKSVELLRDVVVETSEDPRSTGLNAGNSRMKADHAIYYQTAEKIELNGSIDAVISMNQQGQTSEIKAGRSNAFLDASTENERTLSKIELFDSVRLDITQDSGPTNITAEYAMYDRVSDRFDLRENARIVTSGNGQPSTIAAQNVVYERSAGKVFLSGGASLEQGTGRVAGDNINAVLYPSKDLRSATSIGNAFLRQALPERTTEVSAHQMNAAFDVSQNLTSAETLGDSTAMLIPARAADYTKVTMTAPKSINLIFKNGGLLETMTTDGRTTVRLDVPNTEPDASNKSVTADTVRSIFGSDGKNLKKVEAVGKAEVDILPHRASLQNYNTKIHAPRFDCDFFATGNNAKTCVGATGTRTVRTPTIRAEGRGPQTLTANRLTAIFHQTTKDLERLDAAGDAKFTELERNAVADNIVFTSEDKLVRLRGGEPTAWDSAARIKAAEIDWDTDGLRSHFRDGVSTTYYSQKQTGDAMPFADSGKPVFLTANLAEFDHRTDVAVYTGNARGWQDNNYVRADVFVIDSKTGTFRADGSVQSLLYDAERTENGKRSTVPVYATANHLTYNRTDGVLRYRDSVEIRQGPDRITAASANVFLDEKNDVKRTDAEGSVVVTQPKRRATGDYAQYDAVAESIILRGDPATVDDAESGSTRGGELTVFLKDNRVIGEGRSSANTAGRTRSVYKVQDNK